MRKLDLSGSIANLFSSCASAMQGWVSWPLGYYIYSIVIITIIYHYITTQESAHATLRSTRTTHLTHSSFSNPWGRFSSWGLTESYQFLQSLAFSLKLSMSLCRCGSRRDAKTTSVQALSDNQASAGFSYFMKNKRNSS